MIDFERAPTGYLQWQHEDGRIEPMAYWLPDELPMPPETHPAAAASRDASRDPDESEDFLHGVDDDSAE